MRELYYSALRPSAQLTAMAAVLGAFAVWLFAVMHHQPALVDAFAAYLGVLALSARRWSVPPLAAMVSTVALAVALLFSLLRAAFRWLIGRAL